MPTPIIRAIPASQLASVTPSVLSVGTTQLQMVGFIVDSNVDQFGYPVIPLGQILQFTSALDVQGYFGGLAQETGLASVYFTGPDNATIAPPSLLFSGYALSAMPAYLRGGSVAGISLSTLQAINGNLTITIDGNSPISETINLSSATSFSNAAQIINSTLGIQGLQTGAFTASLSGTTMTVTAITNGPLVATVTAELSGTTMTVSAVTGGVLAVGQTVVGTGITAGTTIAAWLGAGAPGGIGSYSLSQSVTTETAETVTAYNPLSLVAGMIVTGTGIPADTYIQSLGTGVGGLGTYTLSQAVTTETGESITSYAPGVIYNTQHTCFQVNSGTTGVGSSVSFASGAAGAQLLLTAPTGAIQSPGTAASASGTGAPQVYMDNIILVTSNWVSFMTTWEPTDLDKESFATWNGEQNDQFVYEMWETTVSDTESSGPSAPVTFITNGDINGVEMIWTNSAVTTLMGEKAAFAMSYTATLDFTQTGGRRRMAYMTYSGGEPDVTNGTISNYLAGNRTNFGYGINFYGIYSTRSSQFTFWQRGFISGEFVWKDSYVNQIALNASLLNDILVGLSAATSLPYNSVGYATVASWFLDTIQQFVNFGAIVPGVTLSQAQIQEVNVAAGVNIQQTLFNVGWYLQVGVNTPPATRATRTSPPCTFWYCDGGQIQNVDLASVELQ